MMLGYIGIVCTSTVKHVYNKVQGIHYISTVIHYVRQASIHYKCVWYINCVLLYYIEDAADQNRQWFTILSHFTSLQRISFTEQILKIDNNTSEFCKQILICLRWFRLWKYMHCIYWQYTGAKSKELIFIQKVCAYHLSDFRYLSKFQIICYLYAHS